MAASKTSLTTTGSVVKTNHGTIRVPLCLHTPEAEAYELAQLVRNTKRTHRCALHILAPGSRSGLTSTAGGRCKKRFARGQARFYR